MPAMSESPPLSEIDVAIAELSDAWLALSPEERWEGFALLGVAEAEHFFEQLSSDDRATLVLAMPTDQRRRWMRFLALDDAADLIQEVSTEDRYTLLSDLDPGTRAEVTGLLAYAEDDAGGLMNPRFPVVRDYMVVDEGLRYLRKQRALKEGESNAVFVLDGDRHLKGIMELSDLFISSPTTPISDIMEAPPQSVLEDTDQEQVARVFSESLWDAVPVLDGEGRMVGIVTADDIVEVVEEEATEDMQKMGGLEALDEPYNTISFWRLCMKRGKWLAVLFVGELFTASAMAHYDDEMKKAVILSLFLPLIISSGGNSGSQASTLIIRAMALGEVTLKEWLSVFRRELMCGLVLGVGLGLLGVLRIHLWQGLGWYNYNVSSQDGLHSASYHMVALTVGVALVGVVLWGTIMGSMLPFLLRRLKLDPATISAPLVATLVDVTGLIIYFSVATIILRSVLG